MQRIRSLIIKELFSILRDNKSRMVLIFPPLIQLFVFTLAATLDVNQAKLGVLNRDGGQPSFELIQRIKASHPFHKLRYLSNEQEIASLIDKQQVVAIVHIDAQFSRHLYAQTPASVQLILDGRKSNTAQIIEGYINDIVAQFNVDFAYKNGFSLPHTALIQRNWYNPNLLYYWFNVPNLCGILTTLISFIVTALSISREREMGTFDQLLVSPLQPFEILLGKTIPALIISLLEGTLIMIAGTLLFRVPLLGSLLMLYLSLIVFIYSIVGMGLFVSCLAKTQQQAILGSFLFITPTFLLSGYATPVENMPRWLQMLDLLNPLCYFLIILKGIFLKNMPHLMVLSFLWPILCIGCATFMGSYLFLKRRLL